MPEKYPEAPKRETSPADLGDRGDQFLQRLWDDLYWRSPTAEARASALAALVRHARHLRPEDHAELAEIIRTPFTQPRGRPADIERREQIWDKYHSVGALFGAPAIPRRQAIEQIANKYSLSHEAAEKAYDQARRGPHPDFED
jgi:hypothetical protein